MDVNKEGAHYVDDNCSRHFIILLLHTCNYESWSEMTTTLI